MASPVHIEGYQLLGLLGRGGMGDVFKAKQLSTGRLCALKLTRSDKADERAQERFRREAEAMARVNHPHLIQLYDSGAVGEELWIAIELIDGASLDRVLANQGALSPELSARLMLETCQALDAMHQEGILHRDVKPANIMIEKGSGRAVLMDLGLAKDPTRTALTQTGHLLGTPVYLPREVFTGKAFDPSVDFFSIGISWWELLTGTRPYEFQQLIDSLTRGQDLPIPPPRSPHGEVPARHLALIQALTEERALRPATWADIQAVLEGRPMAARAGADTGTHTLETHPVPTATRSGPQPRPEGLDMPVTRTQAAPQRSRLALALPSLGLAVLAAGGLFLSRGGGGPDAWESTPDAPRARALLFEETWADRHSVVLGGAAPDSQAVRATRRVAGREVPVPVLAVAPDRFLVWVTGLAPGTPVEVTARHGDESIGARAASVAAGEPSLGTRFPALLRRYHPQDDDAVLARQLATILEIVDTPRALDSEVWATMDIGHFRSFPDALWPAVLALLERDGPIVESLLRCLKLAQTPVPAPVTWHLVHRLADPKAPLAATRHWDIDADYFEGAGVPLALPGRLEEWGEAGLSSTLLRLASVTVRRLGDAAEVRVFPGDRWSEGAGAGEQLDPVPALGEDGLAGLMALAVRARRHESEALDQLLELALEPGNSQRDWALVLVGQTGEESLIEPVLEEYRKAEGVREQAAVAALMGLRTVPGFWTPTDRPMLLRVAGDDLEAPVETATLAAEGESLVVWKPGAPVGFAVVPGKGAELTLGLRGGRTARYRLSAKDAPTRLE